MPKPENPGILEIEAHYDRDTGNFHRIVIAERARARGGINL